MNVVIYLLRKINSIILVAVLLLSTFIMFNKISSDIIPIAFAAEETSQIEANVETRAATVVGTFGFSYKKGYAVDGSKNGKYYSLKKGDNISLNVTSIKGATSASKVAISLRYKQSGFTYIVGTVRLYETGKYSVGQLVNTTNYYLYASGGSGNTISGSGQVLCS